MPLTPQQKKVALAKVDEFKPHEIYDYIRNGDVTFEEFRATGTFLASKQREVRELIEKGYRQDDTDFQTACEMNTVDAFFNYLKQYPTGRNRGKAETKIGTILQMEIDKEKILKDIQHNPNKYTYIDIQNYIKKGQFIWEDLSGRFPPEIIERLKDYHPSYINTMGNTPDKIEEGYTEVYFWGIPSSGKTCALAAILSTAGDKGMIQQEAGTGYGYMTDLMNIFHTPIGMLPESGTRFDETQYLPFILNKKKSREKGARKIALIELSGEIFECFDNVNASRAFKTPDHQRTFNVISKYLKSPNRKIHFFFIDYSDDGSLIKGRSQHNYLNAASLYFKNNKIFDKSTDAIYIVTTKSDYMPSGCNRTNEAKDFLNKNFLQFINGLKNICKKYSINGGELLVEPFSLGNVYFQRICRKDEASSMQILNILLDRVPLTKEGWWNRIKGELNS